MSLQNEHDVAEAALPMMLDRCHGCNRDRCHGLVQKCPFQEDEPIKIEIENIGNDMNDDRSLMGLDEQRSLMGLEEEGQQDQRTRETAFLSDKRQTKFSKCLLLCLGILLVILFVILGGIGCGFPFISNSENSSCLNYNSTNSENRSAKSGVYNTVMKWTANMPGRQTLGNAWTAPGHFTSYVPGGARISDSAKCDSASTHWISEMASRISSPRTSNDAANLGAESSGNNSRSGNNNGDNSDDDSDDEFFLNDMTGENSTSELSEDERSNPIQILHAAAAALRINRQQHSSKQNSAENTPTTRKIAPMKAVAGTLTAAVNPNRLPPESRKDRLEKLAKLRTWLKFEKKGSYDEEEASSTEESSGVLPKGANSNADDSDLTKTIYEQITDPARSETEQILTDLETILMAALIRPKKKPAHEDKSKQGTPSIDQTTTSNNTQIANIVLTTPANILHAQYATKPLTTPSSSTQSLSQLSDIYPPQKESDKQGLLGKGFVSSSSSLGTSSNDLTNMPVAPEYAAPMSKLQQARERMASITKQLENATQNLDVQAKKSTRPKRSGSKVDLFGGINKGINNSIKAISRSNSFQTILRGPTTGPPARTVPTVTHPKPGNFGGTKTSHSKNYSRNGRIRSALFDISDLKKLRNFFKKLFEYAVDEYHEYHSTAARSTATRSETFSESHLQHLIDLISFSGDAILKITDAIGEWQKTDEKEKHMEKLDEEWEKQGKKDGKLRPYALKARVEKTCTDENGNVDEAEVAKCCPQLSCSDMDKNNAKRALEKRKMERELLGKIGNLNSSSCGGDGGREGSSSSSDGMAGSSSRGQAASSSDGQAAGSSDGQPATIGESKAGQELEKAIIRRAHIKFTQMELDDLQDNHSGGSMNSENQKDQHRRQILDSMLIAALIRERFGTAFREHLLLSLQTPRGSSTNKIGQKNTEAHYADLYFALKYHEDELRSFADPEQKSEPIFFTDLKAVEKDDYFKTQLLPLMLSLYTTISDVVDYVSHGPEFQSGKPSRDPRSRPVAINDNIRAEEIKISGRNPYAEGALLREELAQMKEEVASGTKTDNEKEEKDTRNNESKDSDNRSFGEFFADVCAGDKKDKKKQSGDSQGSSQEPERKPLDIDWNAVNNMNETEIAEYLRQVAKKANNDNANKEPSKRRSISKELLTCDEDSSSRAGDNSSSRTGDKNSSRTEKGDKDSTADTCKLTGEAKPMQFRKIDVEGIEAMAKEGNFAGVGKYLQNVAKDFQVARQPEEKTKDGNLSTKWKTGTFANLVPEEEEEQQSEKDAKQSSGGGQEGQTNLTNDLNQSSMTNEIEKRNPQSQIEDWPMPSIDIDKLRKKNSEEVELYLSQLVSSFFVHVEKSKKTMSEMNVESIPFIKQIAELGQTHPDNLLTEQQKLQLQNQQTNFNRDLDRIRDQIKVEKKRARESGVLNYKVESFSVVQDLLPLLRLVGERVKKEGRQWHPYFGAPSTILQDQIYRASCKLFNLPSNESQILNDNMTDSIPTMTVTVCLDLILDFAGEMVSMDEESAAMGEESKQQEKLLPECFQSGQYFEEWFPQVENSPKGETQVKNTPKVETLTALITPLLTRAHEIREVNNRSIKLSNCATGGDGSSTGPIDSIEEGCASCSCFGLLQFGEGKFGKEFGKRLGLHNTENKKVNDANLIRNQLLDNNGHKTWMLGLSDEVYNMLENANVYHREKCKIHLNVY